MVLLIVATVLAALTPSVRRQLLHARVNRVANIIAADLYLAQSVASRQRAPVRVVFNEALKTSVIRLRNGTVVQTRNYGSGGDFNIPVFTASPDSVEVLPGGMANGAVTLTAGDGTYTREVRMTRAGLIRVLR